MAAVPSIVGVEDTRPHERTHPAPAQPTRRWVTFSFGLAAANEATAIQPGDSAEPAPIDRYRLEALRVVGGSSLSSELAALTPGSVVVRREMESVRPATVQAPALQGALELKHSSDEEETSGLITAWARSPWRVALVLLFSHAPAYWSRPREGRGQTYLGWHVAQFQKRPAVLGRVLRRLYRGRSLPASEWDYLAYLEMQPEDVAHVREHLAELRDRKRNPLRNDVIREVELWMTKQVDPSTPITLSDRLRDRLGA
jgi:hypothetical protein